MMANNMIITRYPKVILYTKTEHFGIILFELCNEQTNKPTTPNVLLTPTDRVSMGNNTLDNIPGAAIMTQVILRVHLTHLMNVELRQVAANSHPYQPTWAVSPPIFCYCLHPPSPIIIKYGKKTAIPQHRNVALVHQSLCLRYHMAT